MFSLSCLTGSCEALLLNLPLMPLDLYRETSALREETNPHFSF